MKRALWLSSYPKCGASSAPQNIAMPEDSIPLPTRVARLRPTHFTTDLRFLSAVDDSLATFNHPGVQHLRQMLGSHLELVVIPKANWSMSRRWRGYMDAVSRVPPSSLVVLLDGTDATFVRDPLESQGMHGPPLLMARFDEFKADVVVAGERGVRWWTKAKQAPGNGPWKKSLMKTLTPTQANGGLVAGRAAELHAFMVGVAAGQPNLASDQNAIQKYLHATNNCGGRCVIDNTSRLVHTCACDERGNFELRGAHLRYLPDGGAMPSYEIEPLMMHGAGRSDEHVCAALARDYRTALSKGPSIGDRAAFTGKRSATALKADRLNVDAGMPPPVPIDNGGCYGYAARWLHNVTALRLIMTSHPKTDKATKHNYHVMYHEYLAPLAERKCNTRSKLRMLEVGLGCGYMQPGGSVSMWSELLSFVDFEYHVLEFDAPCAEKWAAAQSDPRVHVHIGSQNSTSDLDRLYSQSGGEPFDAIVDDGPHLNEFQHTTLTHMIERVAPNGFYAVEDIHSSCKDWIANEPGRRANPHRAPTRPPSHCEAHSTHRPAPPAGVGGTSSCMRTSRGEATFFSAVVDWQRQLAGGRFPFPNVQHVDVFQEAVVFGVGDVSADYRERPGGGV